jgi:hypothetical protein
VCKQGGKREYLSLTRKLGKLFSSATEEILEKVLFSDESWSDMEYFCYYGRICFWSFFVGLSILLSHGLFQKGGRELFVQKGDRFDDSRLHVWKKSLRRKFRRKPTNEQTDRRTNGRNFFVFSLLLKQVKARRIQSQKRFTAERFGAPD